MKPGWLTYLTLAALLSWTTITPALAVSVLSPQEMEDIQAGTVVMSNSLSTSGDAMNNQQSAVWLEFSQVFLGDSAQQNLKAVNNVVAADSQAGAQSNVVSIGSGMGNSNTATQSNSATLSSSTEVTNSIHAGGGADDNQQSAIYGILRTVDLAGSAQQGLQAINNVVVAGSQAAAQSNIVAVGQSVGGSNTVVQANAASVAGSVGVENSITASGDATGNSQSADSLGHDAVTLAGGAQQNLQAINNVLAAGSQAAAQSNIATVGGGVGASNSAEQTNDAAMTRVAGATNAIETGGAAQDNTQGRIGNESSAISLAESAQQGLKAITNLVLGDSQAAGQSNVVTVGQSVGASDTVVQANTASLTSGIEGGSSVVAGADASGNAQSATHVQNHSVTLAGGAQQDLQAISNVVAAGSQAAAQSNIVASANALQAVEQTNAAAMERAASATNAIGAGGTAQGNTQGVGASETSAVSLADSAQQNLQAINNVVAAASQAGAQSNVVSVGQSVGDSNTVVQANTASLASGIEGRNSLLVEGDAIENAQSATNDQSHSVTLAGGAQQDLQAINNVLAAGSQAVAQSNIVAVGGGVGSSNTVEQTNDAVMERTASATNVIEAGGLAQGNTQEVGASETSAVSLADSAQQNLKAINNVLVAGGQAAGQSNIVSVGQSVGGSNTVVQANTASLTSVIEGGNSVIAGGDAVNDAQSATAVQNHSVTLAGGAQQDLQAINNVVAAGSQAVAQSNIVAVGGGVGASNSVEQTNDAVMERTASATNAVEAGGAAQLNDQEVGGRRARGTSAVSLADSAQQGLKAVTNLVLADSQAAGQSNVVSVGQSVGGSNTVVQVNTASLTSVIESGSSLAAEGGNANGNAQSAAYDQSHSVTLAGGAQQDLQAVNNVVAAGSQVMAQSNIVAVGGAMGGGNAISQSNEAVAERSAGTNNTINASENASGNRQHANWTDTNSISLTDNAQQNLQGVNNVVAVGSQAAAQSNIVTVGQGVGGSNTVAQSNTATMEQGGVTGNVISTGGNALLNGQSAAWVGPFESVTVGNVIVASGNANLNTQDATYTVEQSLAFGDNAQQNLQAVNNIVAVAAQPVAQSNIVALGGGLGDSNTVDQSNRAELTRSATTTNEVTASGGDASHNSQSATWNENSQISLSGNAQQNLKAVNNLVAVDSQVAGQSNLVSIGAGVGDSNTLTQVNVLAMTAEVNVANAISASGEATGNDQLTRHFVRHGVELTGNAQQFLQAINNVVAAGSQVGAMSNIATVGGGMGSFNAIIQTNVMSISR